MPCPGMLHATTNTPTDLAAIHPIERTRGIWYNRAMKNTFNGIKEEIDGGNYEIGPINFIISPTNSIISPVNLTIDGVNLQ